MKAVLSNCIQKLNQIIPGWQEDYLSFLAGDAPSLERAEAFLAKVYFWEGKQVLTWAPLLQAAFLWQREQRIYRFTEVLASDLIAAGSGILPDQPFPLSVFRSLPDTCIYLSAPGALHGIFDGFLLFRENTGVHLVFLPQEGFGFLSGKLFLSDLIPVKQCLPNSRRLLEEVAVKASYLDELSLRLLGVSETHVTDSVLQDLFLRSLQLALYLVSKKADIVLAEKQDQTVGKEYHVGYRVYKESQGEKRTAHLRRGHWHKYWTGPKSGQQQAVIRWVDAVTVGGADVSKQTD